MAAPEMSPHALTVEPKIDTFPRLEEVDEKQPEPHGDGRRAEIIDGHPAPHSPHFANIPGPGNTGHDSGNDERDHYHFQHAQEEITGKPEIELRHHLRRDTEMTQHQTGPTTQNHGAEHPQGQPAPIDLQFG